MQYFSQELDCHNGMDCDKFNSSEVAAATHYGSPDALRVLVTATFSCGKFPSFYISRWVNVYASFKKMRCVDVTANTLPLSLSHPCSSTVKPGFACTLGGSLVAPLMYRRSLLITSNSVPLTSSRTRLFAKHPIKKIIKRKMDERPKKKRPSDIHRNNVNKDKCINVIGRDIPEYRVLKPEGMSLFMVTPADTI